MGWKELLARYQRLQRRGQRQATGDQDATFQQYVSAHRTRGAH